MAYVQSDETVRGLQIKYDYVGSSDGGTATSSGTRTYPALNVTPNASASGASAVIGAYFGDVAQLFQFTLDDVSDATVKGTYLVETTTWYED